MNLDKKGQAKLRKLLALAERGEGGEKVNASRMLDRMLARHGMTVDDLAEKVRELRWFPIGNVYDRRLAAQIMAKVCDTHTPGTYTSKSRPKQVGVKLTPAEAVEFEIHYNSLRKALANCFQDAYSAFIQANRIFPATPSDGTDEPLTERDYAVMAMAEGITPTPVHAQLERDTTHLSEPG